MMDRFERLPEAERVDRFPRLARKVLAAYGLDDARLLRRASSSHVTFEVSAGGSERHYALRICPPHDPEDGLLREVSWLAALCRDTSTRVPEPILGLDGRLVRSVSAPGVSGVRPCLLLRWIDGEALDAELSPDHLRWVGRLVAVLHNHAETFRWPEELTPPRRNATLIGQRLDERRIASQLGDGELQRFQEAMARIATTMGALGDGPDVGGVIHSELTRRNVLFRDTDAGAIGFDRCRWGYYGYDLVVVRSWIERREQAAQLIAAFLDGYRSLRRLDDEVERTLPAFAALRSIDRVHALLASDGVSGPVAGELEREVDRVRRYADGESR